MTGLVPVIHVVKPPEKLRIGRKRSRVDGRDEPGHDGKGSLNGAACAYLSAYGDEPGHDGEGISNCTACAYLSAYVQERGEANPRF